MFFLVKKSKAQSLGLVNSEIYNRDIVNLIKNKKLKYTMLSVVRTNSGMTSYFTILNNLAGRPDVLTSEMLKKSIIKDLGSFYSVVERVAGDEEFSIEIFKNGNYDSIISYESSLIKLNKELIEMGKEPLYLLYPVDWVALNDMPFAFIDQNLNQKEDFIKLQQFLLKDETKLKLE